MLDSDALSHPVYAALVVSGLAAAQRVAAMVWAGADGADEKNLLTAGSASATTATKDAATVRPGKGE